jgi:hypothetical protein
MRQRVGLGCIGGFGLLWLAAAVGCGPTHDGTIETRREALTVSGPVKVLPTPSTSSDQFGYALRVDGSTAVIAARGTSAGVAYVFEGSGTTWT